MKILITGGSGFLGINLIRYFVKKGIKDIRSFDIEKLDYQKEESIQAILGDVRDKEAVNMAVKDVDIIIHAAAALPSHKEKDIYSTDVEGTKNILEAALQNNTKQVVYISSTAVYGIPNRHPLKEDDSLIGVGPYGKAKIMAEELCIKYRKKGMCICILRPKSFIGPERLGVFALFYDWAKDGKNFPLIGKGENHYQLLDVEDLCEAIYLVMIASKDKTNNVFNIGARNFTTVKEDFQAVLDYAGYGKRIILFPATPSVLMLRFLEFFRLSPLYKWVYETIFTDSFISIDRAETDLRFNPKYSNKDALLRNYKWFLENVHICKEKIGNTHRALWKQGILDFFKIFF